MWDCLESLANKSVVRFYCDCNTQMCVECARYIITKDCDHYPATYNNGLRCPTCKVRSRNIHGQEICQAAESNLVEAAQLYYLPHANSKKSYEVRDILHLLHRDGFVGSLITNEDIRKATDARVRLDVALQFLRKVSNFPV